MDEITSNNTTPGKYDFAEFDKMDLVNVLTYLVISISKYWNIISKINTELNSRDGKLRQVISC